MWEYSPQNWQSWRSRQDLGPDILSTAPRCQDRDGVRVFFSEYYVHLFTSLTLYTTQRNEMTTKSLSSSNGLTRPITPTATTRLLASTVSQPAVMPTTCHVICWPPYMAWKRSIMTKYRVQSIRRSVTWHHVTSRAQMQPSVTPMSVLYMQHAASHGSSLTHILDTIIQKKQFCQETPARNRPEKLERAKNIFWEYWLNNFLSYFLGISNSLAHDNDDKNHGKI